MRSAPPALARPEHTGADRCWPCTAVNLLVLAAATLGLAAVAPVAAGLLAVGGTAAIWLRGYLIPYTPQFAPQVVARLPWDPFPAAAGHPPARTAPSGFSPNDADAEPGESDRAPGSDDPESGPSDDRRDARAGGGDPDARSGGSGSDADATATSLADATTADGEAILADLVDAGVVTATADEVRIAEPFDRRWATERDRLRGESPESLAAATLAVAPRSEAARAETELDREYVVLSDGSGTPAGEVWLRRPVAVAETGAALALTDETDLDPERRAVAAHALAVFLEACPVCETPLVESKAGGCCGPPRTDAEGTPLRALVCEDCRTQFVAFE
ncbi:MAG: hypothetical protein ABEJ26_03110 [Halosimplex sp.]